MAINNWKKFLLMFRENKRELLIVLRYHKEEQKKKRYKGPLLPELSSQATAKAVADKAIDKMKDHHRCKEA